MFHSIIHRSSSLKVDELTIRLVTQKDAYQIAAYYQRNKAFLQPWEPLRDPAFFTVAGWERRLAQLSELHKHNLAYYFVVFCEGSDEICGVINFSNLVRHPFYACHVGYSLDEKQQGKGIMRRALNAAIRWLFEEQHFHRVMAAYIPRNQRSAAVLKAAGFEQEGVAREYLLINGRWEDHILTARVNPNWMQPDAS
ncbi:ribosomal protein S5-alanine N-acetyltransferase [Photobacterium sp. 1_MG-2023]|uniref:ribosomal protein S5-alanine N-acetyltransferase n=1 Tax=Photobacterium sp. 1_MG-2023 TaxID=3062646 RepID=UPI0026E1E2F8|nr:ribosomal protein S5-alanine N-acetyltransferase [Photobacterium sp. 1_MG-2023]MDO6706606.1 ribosomal protein S5-alanine N-acetyltransferase [Photobacterium sp. 1_MG-2023]